MELVLVVLFIGLVLGVVFQKIHWVAFISLGALVGAYHFYIQPSLDLWVLPDVFLSFFGGANLGYWGLKFLRLVF